MSQVVYSNIAKFALLRIRPCVWRSRAKYFNETVVASLAEIVRIERTLK
jgi:hypothetical protein